jgi:hypothetical protein
VQWYGASSERTSPRPSTLGTMAACDEKASEQRRNQKVLPARASTSWHQALIPAELM